MLRRYRLCPTEDQKTLLKIGVFKPSSKACPVCGYQKADLTLKDREWMCPDCGATHDRDLNTATNIKQFVLARQQVSAEEPVDPLPVGRGMIAGKPPAQAGGSSPTMWHVPSGAEKRHIHSRWYVKHSLQQIVFQSANGTA